MIDKKQIDKFFKFSNEEIAQIKDIARNAIKGLEVKADKLPQGEEYDKARAAVRDSITLQREKIKNADKHKEFLDYVQKQFVHVKNDKYVMKIDRSLEKQFIYDCMNLISSITALEHVQFINNPKLTK